jgi:hypothetical protein
MSRADTIAELRQRSALTLTKYVGIAPDGTRLVKRVLKVDADKGFMGIYQDERGRWRANGVRRTEAEIFWTENVIVCSKVTS